MLDTNEGCMDLQVLSVQNIVKFSRIKIFFVGIQALRSEVFVCCDLPELTLLTMVIFNFGVA